MELKVLFLSMTIALLYHTKIVSMQNLALLQTDPFSIEKLFLETFNPFSNALTTDGTGRTILSSPDRDVTFYLFTPSNPDDPYFLKIYDVDNLKESPFNSKWPTKILIHGWMDSASNYWILNFCKNYFMIGDYNVIVVNWYPLSSSEYTFAVKLIHPIGEYVGELLQFLNTVANLSFNDVHILGHSLGAHIAGFAGAKLSGAIDRITGMDPAGPLYELPVLKEPKDRLDPTDALFVDVIHTCAGSLGFIRAIGHIDFYPNGGSFPQPGCSIFESQGCSHSRSYFLMIDSIIYWNEFVAVKCDNWGDYKNGECSGNLAAIMGEHVSRNLRGTYYLETNSKSPYGKAY